MDKLALLRKLNEQLPSVAEQVIGQWGTSELDSYIGRVVREAPSSGLALTADLIDSLKALQAIHLQEFPKFAALSSDAVAARFKENANFQVIEARFPHIAVQIVESWGKRAFHLYIDTLFNDTKRVKRQGFPEDVAVAIFRLIQQHDEEHPSLMAASKDIWDAHDEHGLRFK